MKIFAIVIWFNPKSEFGKNIQSYYHFVDTIIVVDNSDSNNSRLLPNLPNIEYLCNMENKGIAEALNIGCRLSIEKGADWLLTMDQDSSFEPGEPEKLLAKISHVSSEQRIAIVAPRTQVIPFPIGLEECDSVITSGSLVNSVAYQAIGGYNEDLFIDDVDHEFGYRLRRAGYKILRFNDVVMKHTVGEPFTAKVLWRRVSTTNHSYIRKYYMTRSRLYMRRNFPDFDAPYLKMIFIDFLKVLLIEKEKHLKVKYMLKGAFDYLRNVKGRLE
jgi:rhamnosyltransferase